MAIQVGDRLPSSTFTVMTPDGPATRTVEEIFDGRTVVLFGVPGAFTPTCHGNHLPGFIAEAAALKAKGVDTIAVTGVNDVFVFEAWAKASGGAGIVAFLADGNADFARAIGLDFDGSPRGMGPRSQRYAMLVEDRVVAILNIEGATGRAERSGAPALLAAMASRAA